MIGLLVALIMMELAMLLRGLAAADPVIHVLVQLPLLGLAGWVAVRALGLTTRYALTALIVALWGLAFWMLPRSIDAALARPLVDAAKFVSLPVLVGAPLALAWDRLHPVLRGFLKANALSMLGVLGYLYLHAPMRICNSYLVNDQERLGVGFLGLAVALAVLWSVPVFTGQPLRMPGWRTGTACQVTPRQMTPRQAISRKGPSGHVAANKPRSLVEDGTPL